RGWSGRIEAIMEIDESRRRYHPMRTLMVVHAHPDDEGIQTGGVLALYAARGVHTVLVTCTNGEMGDSPDGLKPEAAGHDAAATAGLRLRELRKASAALSVGDLELLG